MISRLDVPLFIPHWSKMYLNFILLSVFWNSLKNDDKSIQPLYNIHKNNTQNWVAFNWASRFHSCVYILKGLSINSDRFELGFLEYKIYSRGLKWEISTISFNCLMFSDVRYLAAISKWLQTFPFQIFQKLLHNFLFEELVLCYQHFLFSQMFCLFFSPKIWFCLQRNKT